MLWGRIYSFPLPASGGSCITRIFQASHPQISFCSIFTSPSPLCQACLCLPPTCNCVEGLHSNPGLSLHLKILDSIPPSRPSKPGNCIGFLGLPQQITRYMAAKVNRNLFSHSSRPELQHQGVNQAVLPPGVLERPTSLPLPASVAPTVPWLVEASL